MRHRAGRLALGIAACCAALALAAPLASAGGSSATASAATCKASNLVVWLPNANGNGAAGSVFYKLRITNLGAACTLTGFPKASAVNLRGQAIGKPASKEAGQKAGGVNLAAGGSASFQLRIVEAGNFSPADCHATMAAGLRVTPPGAGGSRLVPFPFETCAKPTQPVLTVGPVKKS
ncbi:MAG TPA: DUF4232 domain-containing protein [Solirubrobacterales bacterium]|jgi:hypothetical protein